MPKTLRSPTLGPIIGHTTTSSVRLWMRGAEVTDDQRTVAFLALLGATAATLGLAGLHDASLKKQSH